MPTTATAPATPRRRKVAADKSATAGATTVKAEPTKHSYLDNLIPPTSIARSYVSRYVDGVLDTDVLAFAQKKSENVLIAGPTGAGKTMLIRAYASANRLPFVNMAGEGSAEASDYFGGAAVDVVTGGLRWIDGPTLMALQSEAVLNFDEVNFLKGKVTAAFHGVMDGRGVLTLNKHPYHFMSSKTGKYYVTEEDAKLEGDVADIRVTGAAYIKRNPRCLIVATYNPEYQDTQPLNEAFVNRFGIKLEWDYDMEVEKELIVSDNLMKLAEKLRAAKKTGQIHTDVSTNLLMTFERLACEDEPMSFSFAARNFLNHFPAEDRAAVESTLATFRKNLMSDYGWASVTD